MSDDTNDNINIIGIPVKLDPAQPPGTFRLVIPTPLGAPVPLGGNNISGDAPSLQPHPDFPAGDELNLLMSFRDAVRRSGRAMGLIETGCGFGVGGADVTFRLGGKTMTVRIEITE